MRAKAIAKVMAEARTRSMERAMPTSRAIPIVRTRTACERGHS